MNKRIWVKIRNNDRYADFKENWELGTIVGESELLHYEPNDLKSMLNPRLHERYLVQLDNGKIVEAWHWDTYEPVATPSKDTK